MNRPPTQSRKFSRQKSQPLIKPITQQVFANQIKNNYRVNNYNLHSTKQIENRQSNTYFDYTTNYSKNERVEQQQGEFGKNYKQFYFEKEDQEEEISFQSLCYAMSKML